MIASILVTVTGVAQVNVPGSNTVNGVKKLFTKKDKAQPATEKKAGFSNPSADTTAAHTVAAGNGTLTLNDVIKEGAW